MLGRTFAPCDGWPVLEKDLNNVKCVPSFDRCSNTTGAVVAGGGHGSNSWCAVDISKIPHPLPDTLIAKTAETYLEMAAKEEEPFFLGVGFHKPHLPFEYPKEFHDLYPMNVAPPKKPLPPEGMPLCSWHESYINNTWDHPAPTDVVNQFRHAYYASVSYTDYNIGRVLGKLDTLGLANSTVVAFVGDHGWQLGEMNYGIK